MRALVTGASSGIGAAFARRLAAAGYDLALVARRGDMLTHLAAEWQRDRSIAVDVVPADLSQAADLDRLEAYISGLDSLDLLVNNAGLGAMGTFLSADFGDQLDMVRVHDLATMRLCRAALPGMITHGRGRVINVASIAAFLPVPGNAVYSASKAFVVTFSRALHGEVSDRGVRVQALCPGFTYSGFHDTPEMRGFSRSNIPDPLWMTADQVVAVSLAALEQGPVVVIPGFRNRLMVAVSANRFVLGLARRVRRRWK